VSEKLEQPSGAAAEVNNSANSPARQMPDFMQKCLKLVDVPDHSIPHEPDVRCFYLNDGKVFFGIVLSETTDSFLVGASSRLIKEENQGISCEPMIPVAVARVMKGTLCMITEPVPKYKLCYFKYLVQKGQTLLPDYLNEGVLEKVSDFIQTFKEESPAKPVSTASAKNEDFERKGIPGMSEYAFTPSIASEKIH
jgi:hypothetical protein